VGDVSLTRGWFVAALAVAGCYKPTPPAGAPCSTSGECPSGLTCTAGRCTTGDAPSDAPAGDANPVDAAPVDAAHVDAAHVDARPIDSGNSNDLDGDGVPNTSDNCPTTANADQADEDGDRVGDVCDPCPTSVNNTDTDHDGVGDDCDPHPGSAMDHLILFEGFNHGIPTGWVTLGAWTAGSGELTVTAGDNAIAALGDTIELTGHETISSHAVVTTIASDQADPRSVGVVDDYSEPSGVGCEVFINALTAAPDVALVNTTSGAELGSQPIDMSVGDTDLFVERRDGSAFECAGTRIAAGSANESQTVSGTSTLSNLPSKFSLRVHGVGARYQYVMIVGDD
jgi:hypothetical protein